MISYVRGILEEYTGDGIVVEAGGVGYAIAVPATMLDELPPQGEEVKIYTYFQVLEDSQKLFGFRSREERSVFLQLIKVSGIGPKLGMSILSALRPDELRLAVLTGDARTISRAPGLGKKTAEKLIVELKDWFGAQDIAPAAGAKGALPPAGEAYSEAVEALVALGYSSSEAMRAVRAVDGQEHMSTEDVMQEAFRHLAAF